MGGGGAGVASLMWARASRAAAVTPKVVEADQRRADREVPVTRKPCSLTGDRINLGENALE